MTADSATAAHKIAMMRARPAERVWLEVEDRGGHTSFDDVVRGTDLEPLGRAWTSIKQPEATNLLERLLLRNLAYGSEVMPARRARWLAEWFVDSFGAWDCLYGTNRAVHNESFQSSWTPATSFTFDAGLVIIGADEVGVYWVADED